MTWGLGGIDVLGMLGADSPLGATPNASQLSQILKNPDMSQMMQSIHSNPQYMNQLISLNPQLRTMIDSNPQLREMMQNPYFLCHLSSPEMMQGPRTNWCCCRYRKKRRLDLLMNMFGSLGAGGLSGTNQTNGYIHWDYYTFVLPMNLLRWFH